MEKKEIKWISCKDKQEEKEMIELLKEKYKDNKECKFREISDTFILPKMKWIIAQEWMVKWLTKRKLDNKIYTAEVIKNALRKN